MTQESIFDREPQAIPLVLGLSAFMLMVLAAPALLNDPDTYWHIATGRWVLEHGTVPSSDPFSHTMAGAAWHAHEWAAGVLLAIAHGAAGWTGVAVLAAAAIGLTSGILAWGLSQWLRPFYVIAITSAALLGLAPHIVARPHVLVMPLIMLWTVLLVAARARDSRPPLAAALLLAPWANMHGSFPIGLALAGMLALEALAEARSAESRLRVVRAWAPFLVLATLAALATPYGIKGFLFPFHIGGMEKSFQWIGEWHPPDFGKPTPLEAWLMLALAVLLLRGLRVPAVRLVVCLGLLHVTLAHARMADYLILIGSVVIAPVIARQWSDAARRPDVPPLSARGRFVGAGFGASAMIAAVVALAAGDVAPARDKTPVAALEAARRAGLVAEPVFNEYNFGGFLIFSGVPTFIDGRADMYGDAFLDRTLTAASDPLATPGLADLLTEHGIAWTLLSASDVSAQLLDRDPGWVELYRDNVAVIHVRAGRHKPTVGAVAKELQVTGSAPRRPAP